MQLPFRKMNGAGNDFVVVDARDRDTAGMNELQAALHPKIAFIASRENTLTKGCDQLIVLERSYGDADVYMRIYNADGGESGACGNATRCIGWLLMREGGERRVKVQTSQDILICEPAGEKRITVDMGAPRFINAQIPVAEGVDIDRIPVSYEGFHNGVAVGMGNPHVIYFVEDAAKANLAKYGRLIEQEHLDVFPERVNVSAAEVRDKSHIILRVWERGAGLTQACGTAACATLVAAAKKGLTGKSADIAMPGGLLHVEWREDGHVWKTGPVEEEQVGVLEL